MDETLMKLQILARAEITLARVHGRVLARRAVLSALAIGAILLTVIMVNVGALVVLAESHGYGAAAFIVAGANALLAVALLLLARRRAAGPDLQLVEEIRDMALQELSADAEAVRMGVEKVASDLQIIRTGVGSLTHGTAAGLASLGPLLSMLVDALKRRDSPKA